MPTGIYIRTDANRKALSEARIGKPRNGNPENWKHTEETKSKIAELKKGNKNCLGKHWKLSEEENKAKSLRMKGKSTWIKRGMKLPEAHRLNIIASLVGHKRCVGVKHSTEARKRQSLSIKGDRHYNWQGGINPINDTIRKSIEFRLWREAVFARDKWTCQKCDVVGTRLNAHHILNFSQFKELRFAIDNGITLCKGCHDLFHSDYGKVNNNHEQLQEFLKI